MERIQYSSSDPKSFANRALARIRLTDWHGAEVDARKAIEIYGPKLRTATAMKAYFYLAQALLELRHVEEALETAKHAYAICLETRDSSSEILSQFILRAKHDKWSSRETARLREMNETLGIVEDLMDAQMKRDLTDLDMRFSRNEIGLTGKNEERMAIEKDALDRIKHVREAFADPLKPETAERVVPDYLIDNITFEVMHDPVITPSGASYERVALLKHLAASPVDPLTREPLSEKQLIPNVALRNACSEFLEKNGWAVDY